MQRIFVVLALLLLSGREGLPQFAAPLRVPSTVPAVTCSLPFSDFFANGTAQYNLSGPLAVSPGSLSVSPYAPGPAIASVNCSGFGISQYARITLAGGDVASHAGVALFVTGAKNYYFVDCTAGGCTLSKVVAGVSKYVNAFGVGAAAKDTVCAEIDGGTTVKLKVNSTYDSYTYSVSGLSSGVPGVYFGGQLAAPRTISTFQAGNGVCP